MRTAEDAIDALARRLYFKLEHFDPSDAPEWDDLTEDERAVYRLLIEDLFETHSLVIRTILQKELPPGCPYCGAQLASKPLITLGSNSSDRTKLDRSE